MSATSKLFLRAALAVLAMAAIATAQAEEQVLQEGTWTTGGYEVAGEWRITRDGDRRFVELSEDYRTKRAPDLKLFLSPRPEAEIGDRNATDGSVLIAVLESNQGAQRYEIEASVDLAAYRSIVMHCQRFSKYWAGDDLEPSD